MLSQKIKKVKKPECENEFETFRRRKKTSLFSQFNWIEWIRKWLSFLYSLEKKERKKLNENYSLISILSPFFWWCLRGFLFIFVYFVGSSIAQLSTLKYSSFVRVIALRFGTILLSKHNRKCVSVPLMFTTKPSTYFWRF